MNEDDKRLCAEMNEDYRTSQSKMIEDDCTSQSKTLRTRREYEHMVRHSLKQSARLMSKQFQNNKDPDAFSHVFVVKAT